MAKPIDDEPFERELGNALADRLGLVHSTTLREYEAKNDGKRVMVVMQTVKFLAPDEFDDLCEAAAIRAGVA